MKDLIMGVCLQSASGMLPSYRESIISRVNKTIHQLEKYRSPLTGTNDIKLIETIDTELLINDWKTGFQIDITDELHGYKKIYLFECADTKIKFFVPFEIAGSANLYEKLQKFEWYYMPDKWEFQLALNNLSDSTRILEIGSARGAFIKASRSHGLNIQGIELNAAAVDLAKKEKLQVEHINLEELAAQLTEPFDAVCSFHVLEHVPTPKDFIGLSLKVLKSEGKLIFCVPNAESFVKYQRNLLDMPPHHMTRWTEESFKALEKIFPVTIETIIYEPLSEYQVDAYVEAYAKHYSADSKFGKLIFNRYTKFVFKKLLRTNFRKLFRGQNIYAQFRKK
jgi:SAM-dependent methyltransferase